MSDVDWQKLYELKVGEDIIIDCNTLIRRVPGGWVYTGWAHTDMQGCCFIPLTEEGRESPKFDPKDMPF